MNQIHSVCVYSASSTQIDEAYFDAARQLGYLLAGQHIRLVNGAGSIGLMRSVADSVLDGGGEVTGVIPRFMVEQGWHHTGLTQLIEVETMHERKQLMADLSDAVIALPEGIGLYNGLTGILLYLLARIENYTIKSDSSVMAGNKKQINLVIHAMFTLLTQNEITKLAQEKDNPEFSINLPLIYSKWEYPILLQALGTTYLHGIQPGKVTKLLECLLLPFNIASNFPKSKINKQILLQGLVYLSGLRIHPISSRLSQLAQTLEFELKTKHKIPTT